MMNFNQLTWSFTSDELQSSRNGVGLAETYIKSLSNEANIHQRTELAVIFSQMQQMNQLHTPAAQGFISKINFVLKQYGQLAA